MAAQNVLEQAAQCTVCIGKGCGESNWVATQKVKRKTVLYSEKIG